MTNEDTAWEQFSKADGANIGDASAAGMLQAIMAELNSVKADTARLAQKIDGGAGGAPPMDEAAPMGMSPEAPPMDEGGEVPPMEGMEGAPGDMTAGAGDMAGGDLEMPPAPPMPEAAGGNALPNIFANMPIREEDETLLALQDALSQVGDPKAIAKLADIIKDYVEENYEGGAEVPAEAEMSAGAEVPPEALIEELAAGGVPAEPPVDEGGEDMAVAAQLLDALTKSDPEGCGDDASTSSIAESNDASDDSASDTSSNEPAEPLAASDDAEGMEDADEMKPDIQINLFLSTKMDDILNDNKAKGLTDDKSIDTESFKVCDNPIKKSIDDLMNERMRTKSGIDGKRYKISKSATELQREEFASIQKSIGSFDAVKGMRVGDVLTTMKGLRSRGATSIEKSYAPLIDEMVKYCDNNISPLYTAPIFKSFGVDLDKIYEPLDLEPFMRKELPDKYPLGDPVTTKDMMDAREMTKRNIGDSAQDAIRRLEGVNAQYKNIANEQDKQEGFYPQDVYYAMMTGLGNGGKITMSPKEMYDAIKDNPLFAGENGLPLTPPDAKATSQEYLASIAPYLAMMVYGLPADKAAIAENAYRNLSRLEPKVRLNDFRPRADVENKLASELLKRKEVESLINKIQEKSGVFMPKGYQMATAGDPYPEQNKLINKDLIDDVILAKWYLGRLAKDGMPLTIGGNTTSPLELQKYMEYDPEDYIDARMPGEIEDILPGVVSYWKNPAMNIGGKYYPMDAESLEGQLRPYLQQAYNNFDTSAAGKSLGKWIDAVKSGAPYTSVVRPAREGFLKDLGVLDKNVAAGIFGSDGYGIKDVIFENSPLRGIFTKDKDGLRMNPEFWGNVQGEIDNVTGIPADPSLEDDLIPRAQKLTEGVDKLFEGTEPRTVTNRMIGGEDSYLTSNVGKWGGTPLSATIAGNKNGARFLALGDDKYNNISTPEEYKRTVSEIKDVTKKKKKANAGAKGDESDKNESIHGQYAQ